MAPASTQPVGKVFIVYGTVKAVSPGGVERVLTPNSPVYAHEQIVTGPDGSVSITLANNGGKLDLGRMSEVVLDQDVYGAGGQAGATDAVAEVKDIQAALENGNIDPTTGLPAPAAGPGVAGAGGTGAGGGRQIVVFESNHMEVMPDSGADTTGITRNFLDPPPGSQSNGDPGAFNEPPPPPPTPGVLDIKPAAATVNEAYLQNGSKAGDGSPTDSGSLLDNGVTKGSTLDFGNGQTITITGDPGGSLVVNGDYGHLTINSDGTWTYELDHNAKHSDPENVGDKDQLKGDVFDFKVTDSEGNTGGSTVTTYILDDGPTLNVGDAKVYEHGLVTDNTVKTTGELHINYGADGKGSLELSADGWDATWNPDTKTLTEKNGAWELKVNDDGTYTFTQSQNLYHDKTTQDESLSINFKVTVTDGDGDHASANFTVTVYDDVPSLTVGDQQTWDHQLNTPVHGELTITPGADGLGSLQLSADGWNTTWDAATQTLTGHGGAGLTIDPNVDVAWTLQITGDGYIFTQQAALVHDKTTQDESLPINFKVTVTDGDGDSTIGNFTITVHDDVPQTWHHPDNTSLSNEAGSSDTGHLHLTFGADGKASNLPLQLGDKDGNLLGDGQSVVDKDGNALASGGHSLVYEVDPNTGVVNAVFTDDGGVKHTAFSVSLDAEHKTYTVTMGDSPLDLVHQVTTDFSQGSDPNNFKLGSMNVHVTGTYDADGHGGNDPAPAPVESDNGGIGVNSGIKGDHYIGLNDALTMAFQDDAQNSQAIDSVHLTLTWYGEPRSVQDDAHWEAYNGGQLVASGDILRDGTSVVYDQLGNKVDGGGLVTITNVSKGELSFGLQGIGEFDSIVFSVGEKGTLYQIKSLTVDQADQDPVLAYTAIATDGDGDQTHTDVFHVTFTANDGTNGISGASALLSSTGGGGDHGGFHHEGAGDGHFGGGDHDALGSLLGDHHQHNSGGGHHA